MSRTETHEIPLDDLSDHLQLTDEGANASWPSNIRIDLEVRWHPAEPDVGIFTSQAEILDETYYLNGVSYADQREFVDALYTVIGEWCEEGPDEIASMLTARVENEELEED